MRDKVFTCECGHVIELHGYAMLATVNPGEEYQPIGQATDEQKEHDRHRAESQGRQYVNTDAEDTFTCRRCGVMYSTSAALRGEAVKVCESCGETIS